MSAITASPHLDAWAGATTPINIAVRGSIVPECRALGCLCGAQSLFLVFYIYNYVCFTASQMHICSRERLRLCNLGYF